jgi:hypothetical protein
MEPKSRSQRWKPCDLDTGIRPCSLQKQVGSGLSRSRTRPDIPLLHSLYVLSLKTFGAFGDFELYRLAFLQAAEAACLNSREVHEYIFPGLTADKAIAFGVVKPFHCSLFHVVTFSCFLNFLLRENRCS